MNLLYRITRVAFAGMLLLAAQGCWFAAGTATGVAASEVLEDEGYEIDSPIEKADDEEVDEDD